MSSTEEAPRRPGSSAAARMRQGVRLVLGTFIIVSVVVNCASVIARYVFLAPLFWAEPVIVHLMIWSVFIGAALVSWDDKHLNVDIVSSALSRRWQAILRMLGALCLLAVVAIVIPQSWQVTEMMVVNDQRMAIGDLPMAVPHSALLVGFGLMALAALYHVFKSMQAALGLRHAARRGEGEATPPNGSSSRNSDPEN